MQLMINDVSQNWFPTVEIPYLAKFNRKCWIKIPSVLIQFTIFKSDIIWYARNKEMPQLNKMTSNDKWIKKSYAYLILKWTSCIMLAFKKIKQINKDLYIFMYTCKVYILNIYILKVKALFYDTKKNKKSFILIMTIIIKSDAKNHNTIIIYMTKIYLLFHSKSYFNFIIMFFISMVFYYVCPIKKRICEFSRKYIFYYLIWFEIWSMDSVRKRKLRVL